jgi:hypothetical protein
VASRVCPKCNAILSAGVVAAFSNGIECPNCHTQLELSSPGRMLSAWAGMAAGYLAWRVTRGGPGILGAVAPLLYAVLSFGFVSALVVMMTGDLGPAPESPAVETSLAGGHAAPAAHSGGHH